MATLDINDVLPEVDYTAIAAQTAFTVPFEFFADADLVVLVDGAVQALNTDYTVTGAEVEGGGSVTFTAGLAGGEAVRIYTDIAIARDVKYTQSGSLSHLVLERDMAKQIRISQQLERDIGRCIRLMQSDPAVSMELPLAADRANKYLAFGASGELEVAEEVTGGTLSQSVIGGYLYPVTAAETAAGVTPAYYYYAPGDIRRYGANTVPGTTDMRPAVLAAIAQNEQSGGAPIVTWAETYFCSAGLAWCSAGQDDKEWIAHNSILTFNSAVADQHGLTIGPIGSAIESVGIKLWGRLYVVNNAGSAASTKVGIRFQQCYEGKFYFDSFGWAHGYQSAATHTNCGYNDFYPGIIKNNTRGYSFDITSPGVVNQNNHWGGRFTVSNAGQWLIDMYETGHNSNRWWGTSFESGAGSSLLGYVYLDGNGNQLIDCRFEAGGTIAQNWVVIDPTAQDFLLKDCYGLRDFFITGRGEGGKIYGRDEVIFVSDSGGQATQPTLGHYHAKSNDNGVPNGRFWEVNASSAQMGGLEVGGKSTSGNLLNLVTLGSLVDAGPGTQSYICILGHTSSAADQPGVGVNWPTYWMALPTGLRDLGGATWALTTVYSAPTTRLKVDASGVMTLLGGPTVRTGIGTPEGAVTAGVGSLFLRIDGGATTTLYVKTSGSGNTGWTAK